MRALWRTYPATLCAVALVTVGFVLQWFVPLEPLVQRHGAALWSGQWWRLMSSFLVQGSGWGQFAFNTLGLVLVGAAVERVRGTGWWLAAALGAHIGTVLIVSIAAPDAVDTGSSLLVGGLVGFLTLTRFTAPRGWVLASAAYGVFFTTYLAALALAGPVAGAIAGSVVAGGVTTALHRSGLALWARRTAIAIVVVATAVLIAFADVHGIATAIGMLVAVVAAASAARSGVSGRSAARR
jgi:hypothetical protein